MEDKVNHPKHYQLGNLNCEVIDVRDALFESIPEGTPPAQIDCWSRGWEYLTRMWKKNGQEDLQKAIWYLQRLDGLMSQNQQHLKGMANLHNQRANDE